MVIVFFIIAAIFTLFPFHLDYKAKSPFTLLWMLNFIFVYIPLLVSYLSGYDKYIILEGLIFYICCNTVYTMVLLFSLSKNGDKFNIKNFPLGEYKYTVFLIYFALIVLVLVFVINGISVNRILNSTLVDKRELGGAQLAIIFIISFLAPYTIWLFKEKKYKILILIVLAYITILLYYRSRSILSFMLLPVAYYLLFWAKKGKLKLLFIGGGAYLISQIIKVIRYQGALNDGLSVDKILTDLPTIIESNFEEGRGDLSIGSVYLNIIRDYSDNSIFGNFTVIHKLISKIIPFIDEPRTIEYLLWDYYYDFGENGSLHPTCYGVAYADGGWFGMIYFFFLALLRIYIQKITIRTKDVRILGFTMYFILFFSRGSIYNGFIFMIIPILLWALFLRKNEKSISSI